MNVDYIAYLRNFMCYERRIYILENKGFYKGG